MFKQWKGVADIFKRYWRSYGGFTAFIASPYLHISIVFAFLTVGYWSDNSWWSQSLLILPSLLGFTLGGFAVFLSLGSEDFRSLMAQPDEGETTDESPYMTVIGSFVHFVLIQMIAILVSILANAASYTKRPCFLSEDINLILNYIVGFTGYGLFLYSLLLALSVCFAIYRMSGLFTQYDTINKQNKEKAKSGKKH